MSTIAEQARATRAKRTGPSSWEGPKFPRSGTSGDGAGHAAPGELYRDTTRGTTWINKGTKASPYWSPTSYQQRGLWGVQSDYREIPATALTDTAAAIIHATGLRVFGQGIAETDAGALANASGEGPLTLRMTTTDEAAHTIAIGTKAGVYQPDLHDMAVVEVPIAHVSAITLRGFGIGFVGLAADAFDPPVTCATTVCTLVLDDLALMHFNVGYTDGDRWMVGHNKSNAAATMTVVDTGVDVAAAATYQLLRVECDADGTCRFFIDKVLVATVENALDADEEHSPVAYIESTSAAVKSCDAGPFMFVAGIPLALGA